MSWPARCRACARSPTIRARSSVARESFSCGAVGQVGDHLDELGAPVTVLPGELDELASLGEDGATLRRAGDGDAAAAAELQQPLVPEHVQRAQHGVLVHAE